MSSKQEEVVAIIRKCYQERQGKITPYVALKEHYGNDFTFHSLGLGKYNTWFEKNSHLFEVEKSASEFLYEIDREMVTELDLLIVINKFFAKSEMYSHRRNIHLHLQEIYGPGPFQDFGHGNFYSFLRRFNLNMGIAKRTDFSTHEEWKLWRGRKV